MEIHKTKLPAGLSYALKPSRLEALLDVHPIRVPITLHQWAGRELWGERTLFAATFYPPGQFYRNEGEVLHISSYAVPTALRQYAAQQLDTILPEFFGWIEGLLAEPEGSTIRRETQRFTRKLELE